MQQLQNRLHYAVKQVLQQHHLHYKQLKSSIEQLSPQAVLARGYAIVSHDHQAITNSAQLALGQAVHIQLHIGEAEAHITKK